MTDHYEDIINLPHPISKNHPQMTMASRAAQFAPFAALTGYGEAISETVRVNEEQFEEEEGLDYEANTGIFL